MEQLQLPLDTKVRLTQKDGKVYFLHHSINSIKVGDVVKPASGTGLQITAGDALTGYSYGWDLAGKGAITEAINNQAGAQNIYLTSAPIESVGLDANVPGSAARTIKRPKSNSDCITVNN